MLSMLLQCLSVDQNVVHICSAKDVQDIRTQDIIDVVSQF